jgi:thiamine transport system permease protein
VPVARALARRRFAGRRLFLAALGVPFLLPVIVAVLGLLAVFGRGGVLNGALAAAGLPPVSPYGLQGVVLAHVFLNLPLAVRLILLGWQAIPAERFRLAAGLGFGPAEVARHIERPMLRAVLPGALLAVFLICLTSFAVALILGGGPRATTLELAIYQAIRFEFDLGRAAALAAVQVALCVAAVLAAAALAGQGGLTGGLGGGLDRPVTAPRTGRLLGVQDAAVLALAGAFLAAPLLAIVVRGAAGLPDLPAPVWAAAARSVAVALVAAGLAVGAALALALAVARGGVAGRLAEAAGMLPLAASSLVLGTGLFLILFPLLDPARIALPVTAAVNAAMALPFALRILLPAVREVEATQGRLAASLGIAGRARLRLVLLPRLRAPLGLAAGLVAALAMGDLGVIALFATDGGETLPLQVYRLMGSYRTDDAAAGALLLAGLSLGLFWLFDRGGRDARG